MACEIDAMLYVYVLKSLKDDGLYIGCTKDLRTRMNEHASGSVESTRDRLPVKLVYYEACLNGKDAFRREK